MNDYFGNKLSIGDQVAFYAPGYRMFTTGTVIKFTPKQVKVEYNNTWNYGPEGHIQTYIGYPKMFIKDVSKVVVPRIDVARNNDDFADVMKGETTHDHLIVKDESGTLRWLEDPEVKKLIDSPDFSLNDWWITRLQMNSKAKNDPEVRKFYRDMGYSIYGYWEIFYWEINNEYADEWEG